MTTILATFAIALALSILLTPFSKWFGRKFGAVDVPNERKIHTTPMPRTGGLAIVLSFILVLVIVKLWQTQISDLFVLDRATIFFLCGALIVFGIGFFDDFHRIHAGIKFLFQVAAAIVAFFGGLKIGAIGIFDPPVLGGFYSFILTVFWFVLIINAVNLVDGMDGLAGGIVVFACVAIVMLNILREEYLSAMLFAALGGATLGFLRYNFNPASIFLGDGGSYFLGYAIAGLSILSGAKAQMGAILLIPMLALGVPLFDTILAPVRRFIRGKKMFSPDNGHIHHRMQEMGLTSNRVVWLLYAVSFCLCILAVIVVNLRDERAGLFLIVLGVGAVFFVRKLGYFEYFATDKVYGWLRDITDVAGISHDRRSFLSLQMDINSSKNAEELWWVVGRALEMLEFDYALLQVNKGVNGDEGPGHAPANKEGGDGDRRRIPSPMASVEMRGEPPAWEWSRKALENPGDGLMMVAQKLGHCLMRIELPLLLEKNTCFGILLLIKDVEQNNLSHYTLRRVEHLRRTICSTLQKLQKAGKLGE